MKIGHTEHEYHSPLLPVLSKDDAPEAMVSFAHYFPLNRYVGN